GGSPLPVREVWRELAWAHQEGTQSCVPHIQNAAINLRLDQLGLPLPEGFEDTEWARLVRPILARQRELSRRLSERLCAADGRIQGFLDDYLAFAVFRAALAKDPDLVTAHLGLAAIYRSTGRPDWAALEERAAASLDCKTHAVDCDIVAGRYEAALAATSGDRTPRGIYFRAQARTGLANAAFAKVAQLPPSPDLHLYKAGLEYEAGHREQVVEELRQGTQLAPRDVALRRELAMAMGAAAHYDAAYRLATELLRDDPGSDELNALAGDALLNLQKAEEAIPFLKKSAVANPRNPVTQRSLGMADF